MGPEGNILVNSPFSTYQQGLTNSAVGGRAESCPNTFVQGEWSVVGADNESRVSTEDDFLRFRFWKHFGQGNFFYNLVPYQALPHSVSGRVYDLQHCCLTIWIYFGLPVLPWPDSASPQQWFISKVVHPLVSFPYATVLFLFLHILSELIPFNLRSSPVHWDWFCR